MINMQLRGGEGVFKHMAVTKQTGWTGWAGFAGIAMVFAGLFEGFEGFVALLRPAFYLVTKSSLVAFNFTAWGWIHLLIALGFLAAGFAILNGNSWGRVVGVIFAGLSLLAAMLFMNAYPVLSHIVMIIDAIVVYAVVVRGETA